MHASGSAEQIAILPAPAPTLATWTHQEIASGQLTAATLPVISSPIGCVEGDGGLLPTSTTLSWSAPAGMPEGAAYELVFVRAERIQPATTRKIAV